MSDVANEAKTDGRDERLSQLKNATRLYCYDFVAYDRDGHLGFRVMSPWSGPTEAGVEYDYAKPLKLEKNETPIQCCDRVFGKNLPDRDDKTQKGPATELCSLRDPHFEIGSRQDLNGDLLAVVKAAADRFKADLGDRVFMFYALAGIGDVQPKLCLRPSEFFLPRKAPGLTNEIRSWLIEDLMRLEAGIFRRNRPVGCSGYSPGYRDHFHEPVRFAVMTHFQGSGHEMLEHSDRYQQIVAAAGL